MKLSLNNRHSSGFTLVELLVVLGVIVILGGITFGMTAGIQSARMKSIAKAEIALISQSLSQFYAEHGDYPITEGKENNEVTLSKSLLGWKVFQGTPVKLVDRAKVPHGGVKALIDPSKILYEGDLPASLMKKPRNVKFIDPWGQAYVYAYKQSKDWDNFSFVLYSKGPDGADTHLPKDGVLSTRYKNFKANIDNIYLED